MTADLPTGTVTFLFTDIEGSTRLAQEHPLEMPALLARHNEILRHSIETYHGYVFLVVGDSFCAAFHTALDAVQAASTAQRSLSSQSWSAAGPLRVRMGVHTGAAQLMEDGQYSGYTTLAAAQRIMSAGNGGQTLLSSATRELVYAALPDGADLSDLGEKRLKDILYPERLYQLNLTGLPTLFPPLRALAAFPNNLPTQLTSFIGRDNEIAEIKAELETHRLITLTGSGGTGKTRLALQIAAELHHPFTDGIWFIELAPLTNPDLIPQALLSEIGILDSQGRQPLDVLKEYFQTRKSLLILDNCEHLVSACARLANVLLNAAPDLKVLATSREALGVKGELSYPVPSLSLPDSRRPPPIAELGQVESVRLFLDRASLVAPHFVLDNENAAFIAQICYRLDGIPLAIELAAARIKVLSPEQIANRLADRFRLLTGGARTALPRQQTLRALIDWSYDLLADQERLLLLRLSVFAGSLTLAAAEQVCAGDGLEPYEILDLLSQLVNKSLVVVVDQSHSPQIRYRMLETIRQYAREKLLETSSGAAIRDKHLDYYLHKVARAEQEFYSPQGLAWLVWFDWEWDNLRAAVEWSFENCPGDGLALVNCLAHILEQNLHVSDLQDWLFQLLSDRRNSGPTILRAYGLLWLALSLALGALHEEYATTRSKADEAITIFEALDDQKGLSDALRVKAAIDAWTGDPAKGIDLLERALQLARALNDKPRMARCLLWLGFAPQTHQTARKLTLLKESLFLYRELGYIIGILEVLKQLGAIELRQANFEQAHCWLDEAQSILHEHAPVLGTSETVSYDVGDLAYFEGNYPLAEKYYLDCLAWADRVGSSISISYARARLGFLYTRLGDLPTAAAYFRQALDLFHKFNHTHGLSFTLDGLAGLAVAECRWEKAALMLAWANNQYAQILGPRSPVEQASVERDLAAIRAHLDQAEWTALAAQGRSLTAEAAIQLVLA